MRGTECSSSQCQKFGVTYLELHTEYNLLQRILHTERQIFVLGVLG